MADQVDADSNLLKEYGTRPKTQREHQVRAMEDLSFRRLEAEEDQNRIQTWLIERALEHDRPSLLIEAVCEKLRRE